jgi:hypothetical protein
MMSAPLNANPCLVPAYPRCNCSPTPQSLPTTHHHRRGAERACPSQHAQTLGRWTRPSPARREDPDPRRAARRPSTAAQHARKLAAPCSGTLLPFPSQGCCRLASSVWRQVHCCRLSPASSSMGYCSSWAVGSSQQGPVSLDMNSSRKFKGI